MFSLIVGISLFASLCVGQNPGALTATTPTSCYERCTANSKCLSYEGIEDWMRGQSSSCATCVNNRCRSLPTTSKELPDCMVRAYGDCTAECPSNSQPNNPMSMCGSCLVTCLNSNVPVNVQPYRQNGQVCRRDCRFIGSCPTINQTISAIRQTEAICRSCIQTQCGYFETGSLTLQVADCLYTAKQKCDVCEMTDSEKMKEALCEDCMKRCKNITAVPIQGRSTSIGTSRSGSNINRRHWPYNQHYYNYYGYNSNSILSYLQQLSQISAYNPYNPYQYYYYGGVNPLQQAYYNFLRRPGYPYNFQNPYNTNVNIHNNPYHPLSPYYPYNRYYPAGQSQTLPTTTARPTTTTPILVVG